MRSLICVLLLAAVTVPVHAAPAASNDPTLQVIVSDAATGNRCVYDLEHSASTTSGRFILNGTVEVLNSKGKRLSHEPVFLPLADDQLSEDTVTMTANVARIDYCNDVIEWFEQATFGATAAAASQDLEVVVSGDWPASLVSAVGMPLEVYFAGVFTEIDACNDDDDHPVLPDPHWCNDQTGSLSSCVACCDGEIVPEIFYCENIAPPAERQACLDAAYEWNSQCRTACLDGTTWPDPDNCGNSYCDDNQCANCCAGNANEMSLWCHIAYPGPDQLQERNECLDNVQDWLGWCIDGCANLP